MQPDFIIYSDGGARGNPGPAAYGFVVIDALGRDIVKRGRTLGKTTNNVAEYMGAIEGLKALRAVIGKKKARAASVEVRMDSELVVKQMNGEYRIKGENITPLFIKLWNLRQDFASVMFTHVRREQNHAADKLVNEALDSEHGGLAL